MSDPIEIVSLAMAYASSRPGVVRLVVSSTIAVSNRITSDARAQRLNVSAVALSVVLERLTVVRDLD